MFVKCDRVHICTLGFSYSNTLYLTFSDKRPLKFSKCAHDRKKECGNRCALIGKGHILFNELDLYALSCKVFNKLSQVVKVTGEPIHALNYDEVTLPHILEHCI